MSRRPLRLPLVALLVPVLALAACAGATAEDEAVAPQPAAAQSGEAVPQNAVLVRPSEDDGRSQRERDLETVGRGGGR